MAIWTDELKQQVIDTYLGSNPTAENSGELIKEIQILSNRLTKSVNI